MWRVPVGLNPFSWPWRTTVFDWEGFLIGRAQTSSTNFLSLPEKGGHFYAAPDQAGTWGLQVYPCSWSGSWRGQPFGQLPEKLLGKQSEEPSLKSKSKFDWPCIGANNENRLSRNEISVGLYTLLETIHFQTLSSGSNSFWIKCHVTQCIGACFGWTWKFDIKNMQSQGNRHRPQPTVKLWKHHHIQPIPALTSGNLYASSSSLIPCLTSPYIPWFCSYLQNCARYNFLATFLPVRE